MKGYKIMIRTMTIEDYEGVKALWMSIKGFAIRSIDDSREGVARFLQRNPTPSVVAVEDGRIVSEQIVDTNGSGHGALAGLLSDAKADVLICGGIGGGAQMALAEAGIKLYGGAAGDADAAVAAFLRGELAYNPDVRCSHHDHGGHGHGSCGENKHGCGGSSCH